jgi:hypothetical protein
VIVEHLETVVGQPVERGRGVLNRQPHQHRVGRVAADAHDVVVVGLRRVEDAAGLLQLRPGRAHLPGREEQRAAELARGLDDQHARTALRGEDRRRKPGVPATDHHEIPALPPRRGLGQATCRARSHGRGARRLEELALGHGHDRPPVPSRRT